MKYAYNINKREDAPVEPPHGFIKSTPPSFSRRNNVRGYQNMKAKKTIFSFWEPKGNMTPYLELCRKTWERNLPDYEIIFLDYSNLGHYLPEGVYDINIFRKLTFMMQKDAVMVAVLKEHGGVFMDADTLVTGEIAPLLRMLRHTEVIMFSAHMAFVAAQPGSYLLTLWYKKIQQKLNFLKEEKDGAPQFQQWDFIGNSSLADVMDEMIGTLGFFHRIPKNVSDKFVSAYMKITNHQKLLTPCLKELINRLGSSLARRKREFYFRHVFKHHLTMLDRLEYGFIPEALYFKSKIMTPEEKYRKFWFDNSIDIKDIFGPHQVVIGLHHSWIPRWYKELSEKGVLADESLLSRTLKHLLT
ncbi:MAG: capsular polysaccharide synthesis protein [Smithella sp.]